MKVAMSLLMIFIFFPPVAALFVLIKRLREEKYRNKSDARDKFFESICLNNLQTEKDKKPLSDKNTDNADIRTDAIKNNTDVSMDTIIDNTEDNKDIIPAAEKTAKTDPALSDLPETQPVDQVPADKKENDIKNHSSIGKEEAVNLVMNMIKQNKENGNSQAQLKDMIELLKTGKDNK